MMAQQHVSSRRKGRSTPRSRDSQANSRRSQVSFSAQEIVDCRAETSRGTGARCLRAGLAGQKSKQMAKSRGRTLTRATQGPQLYALDKGRSELASLMRLPDDARQPLTTKDKAKDQGQDPQTTVKGNEPDDACIQLSESDYYHPTDKDKVLLSILNVSRNLACST